MENIRRHPAAARPVSTYMGIVLLGLLSLDIPAVSGQSPVQVGDKVRVTAPRIGLLRSLGVVREVGEGTLAIDFGQPGGAIRVRGDEIWKIEVTFRQRIDHSHFLIGIGIGFFAGAGIGWFAGHAWPSKKCPEPSIPQWTKPCTEVSKDLKGGVGALIGGMIGAGLGAVIGSSFKEDIWVPVTVGETKVSVSPLLHLGRSSPSISAAF